MMRCGVSWSSGHGRQNQGDTDDGTRSDQSVDLVSPLLAGLLLALGRRSIALVTLMQERLEVLRGSTSLFAQRVHFCDLDYVERRKIAGLFKSVNPDFLLFGSMQWVGFSSRRSRTTMRNFAALDEILFRRRGSRDQYERFRRWFPESVQLRDAALASRLLAMSGPDTFVCVNSEEQGRVVSSVPGQPELGRRMGTGI